MCILFFQIPMFDLTFGYALLQYIFSYSIKMGLEKFLHDLSFFFFSLFVLEICNGGCWQSQESEFEKGTDLFLLQGHGIVFLIVTFLIYFWASFSPSISKLKITFDMMLTIL